MVEEDKEEKTMCVGVIGLGTWWHDGTLRKEKGQPDTNKN